MRNLIRCAWSALQPPERPLQDTEARTRQHDQEIVERFATGNIRLQRGEFSTREDLDREYDEVQAYPFDDAE